MKNSIKTDYKLIKKKQILFCINTKIGFGMIEMLLYLSLLIFSFSYITPLVIKTSKSQYRLLSQLYSQFHLGYIHSVLRQDLITCSAIHVYNAEYFDLTTPQKDIIQYNIRNKKLFRQVNGIGHYLTDEPILLHVEKDKRFTCSIIYNRQSLTIQYAL